MGKEADGLVLKVGGEHKWEKTETRQVSETIQMSIPPQQKVSFTTLVIVNLFLTCSFEGALLAQVPYKSTNGTLQIGNE
jgi:hypothetical protein